MVCEFMAEISAFDPSMLLWLDETGSSYGVPNETKSHLLLREKIVPIIVHATLLLIS